MLPRSQILGPRTAISNAMEQILGWARLWFAAKRDDEGEAPLRNGAWYPILSSGVNRAVLEVSGQRVAVPQDRSEERRVGKECRCRWSSYDERKKRRREKQRRETRKQRRW